MAYPNIGLDWYRLLSIYSVLGSSKSMSQKQIETELQTLRALNVDVVNAIQSVNQTLRNLISRGKSKLTDQELAKLKQAVVDGMAEHVSRNPAQCSNPVACDGESILFTPEVREVLASLVEQKAAVLNGTEKHLTEQEVQDIAKAVAAEMDVRNLSTQSFKDAIGAFFQDEQKVEALADVVATRIESVSTPSTEALTDALRTFFGKKENWDAFAATILERIKADTPSSDDRLDIITGQLGYLTKKNLADPEMNLIATKVVEKMGSRNVNQEDIDAIAAKVADKMPAALPTNSLGTEVFKDALDTFFSKTDNWNAFAMAIVERINAEASMSADQLDTLASEIVRKMGSLDSVVDMKEGDEGAIAAKKVEDIKIEDTPLPPVDIYQLAGKFSGDNFEGIKRMFADGDTKLNIPTPEFTDNTDKTERINHVFDKLQMVSLLRKQVYAEETRDLEILTREEFVALLQKRLPSQGWFLNTLTSANESKNKRLVTFTELFDSNILPPIELLVYCHMALTISPED